MKEEKSPIIVIPANAGIQENTGYRIKFGMTNSLVLMMPCINERCIGIVSLIMRANTLKGTKAGIQWEKESGKQATSCIYAGK